MVNAVYDHIIAILIVGVIFVGAVVTLPAISFANLRVVDQQQLRNTALSVFSAMLLDTGEPAEWGSIRDFQKNDSRVQRFGLASSQDSTFYVLDPNKVQRLVVGNPLNYCDYSRVRQLLGLQDYGFRLKIIPPFNVTFLNISAAGNYLYYGAKVSYVDGSPIPNAQSYATIVYAKGSKDFNITRSGPVGTNAMGMCEGNVPLSFSDPDYYVVILRVTVSDVATMVVTSKQAFNNTIAKITVVYDSIVLTSWKEPPDYNVPPNDNIWITDIYAFGSDGSLWYILQGDKDDRFFSGSGSYIRWSETFDGLHDFEPVLLIFNFWAVDPEGKGRQQVLITIPYPELLGTNIFEYGGSPGDVTVRLQRSVIISGMTYTAQLLLWKESA